MEYQNSALGQMEKYEEKIQVLKKELLAMENNAHRAAFYGNQLLQQNGELSKQQELILSEIECLKQENYSLRMKVDLKEKTIVSHSSEMETLKEYLQETQHEFEKSKKDNAMTYSKVRDLQRQNDDLIKMNEEMCSMNNEMTKQVLDLENEIKDLQEKAHVTLNETFSEDYQQLQCEHAECLKEMDNLQHTLIDIKVELEYSKAKELTLTGIVRELQEELQGKEQQLSLYSDMAKKCREEVSELEATIELLKVQQVDVNQRGNSVFSELDDRRLAVEKQYRMLCDKYKSLRDHYDHVVEELRLTKKKVITFYYYFTEDSDRQYMHELEDRYSLAKHELRGIHRKFEQVVAKYDLTDLVDEPDPRLEKSNRNQLYTMYRSLDVKYKQIERDNIRLRLRIGGADERVLYLARKIHNKDKEMKELECKVASLELELDKFTNDDLIPPCVRYKPYEPFRETIPCSEDELNAEKLSVENAASDQGEPKDKMCEVLSEKNTINCDNVEENHTTVEKDVIVQAVEETVPDSAVENDENVIPGTTKYKARRVTAPTIHISSKNVSNCTQQ